MNFTKNNSYTMEINVKMDVPENATEEQLKSLRDRWKEHGHYIEDQKIVKEYNTAYVEVNGQNVITNKPETEVQLSTNEKNEARLAIRKVSICYEPQDKRCSSLHGKSVKIQMKGRYSVFYN